MRLTGFILLGGLLATAAVGCGEEEGSTGTFDGAIGPGPGQTSDGGTWVPGPDGGSWVYDSGTLQPGSDGGSQNSGLALPPDVCKVLQDNRCVTCHQETLTGGAPMSLQMRDHFAGIGLNGSTFAERSMIRIKATTQAMPPSGDRVSAADQAILQAWIDGGMPGVQGEACKPRTTPVPETVPTWASRPWPEGECEYVMKVGAHNTALVQLKDDPSPFNVPTDTTHYHCFYEKVPWGTKQVHALAMRAVIESADDTALVHHLVLSGVLPGQQTIAGARPAGPGDHKRCDNPNGSTMAIWAPGAQNPLSYPEDVGVQLPSGNDAYVELQVHYDNRMRAAGKKSRVSYEICATSKLKKETAGVFWLGYENANAQTLIPGFEGLVRLDNKNNGTAVGRCAAKTQGRILSIMPHMHEKGIHSTFQIARKNGTVETVFDDPFDFREQASYFRENLLVDQGDTVRTTCKWSQPNVSFGFPSNLEMCFFYTLAYPISVFKAGLNEKGIVGGDLACAGGVGP